MKISYVLVLCFFIIAPLSAQNYTSYFTGDIADVSTSHQTGVCLMGGATENDEAMKWFLNRADGGDILVLRASGSDGYNDYFFSELGVEINSVETLVLHNAAGAIDPYVLTQIENAEAIWFAGGDQYNYVSYFKGTEAQVKLNDFINVKQGTIGGTSAGMAILGGQYFDAENGTVTSQQALNNPYHNRVSIGVSDFMEIPILSHVITDTHFDDPDRRGRLLTFLARIATDTSVKPYGIACEEYTAVCIDELNIATVYGGSPEYDDAAYFVQTNCGTGYEPETCEANTPLTWQQNADAVRAFKVQGTNEGNTAIDLNTWEVIEGAGTWEHWTANSGAFLTSAGEDPMCYLLGLEDASISENVIVSNPFNERLTFQNVEHVTLELYDLSGKLINLDQINKTTFNTAQLSSGMYIGKLTVDTQQITVRLLKQ